MLVGCFVYRKGTIFQANHNYCFCNVRSKNVVLYTAKVRFFKQITTASTQSNVMVLLFCIPQRYDFSSKSQLLTRLIGKIKSCFVYRKGTIFQANHNGYSQERVVIKLFCIPQRYDFSSKSQLILTCCAPSLRCFVYRKGTIFQANHNRGKSIRKAC